MKYLLILTLVLFSCSDAKIVTRSIKRANAHGYKVVQTPQITILDNDSVFNQDGVFKGLKKNLYPCICLDQVFPESNTKIRQDGKNIRKELKYDYKKDLSYKDFIIDSLKNELKFGVKNNRIDSRQETKGVNAKEKTEQKKLKRWNLFWIGFSVGIALVVIILIVWRILKVRVLGFFKIGI